MKPVLEKLAPQLATESAWNDWARQENGAIRARLEQGDRDSMVNLLLFGTSFTKQPRIQIDEIAQASRSGVLRARLDDLLKGIRAPKGNERLIFVRALIPDPDGPRAGVFVLQNLERVLQELREFGERKDRAHVFHDRGVSLDSSILPNFAIEQALAELKSRGMGEIKRAAVIGPGLDFVDWDSGYDYYPAQMLQPFAVYDSLVRVGLAKNPQITVFDISPRSLDHLRRARERARKGADYAVQLPRDPGRPWTPAVIEYWRRFGDRIGASAAPLQPPALLKGLETRAVRIRPEIVLAFQPVDLNIVLERDSGSFDLVIATNVLVYYDALGQALALENALSMLTPSGWFLANTELPQAEGITSVKYADAPGATDRIYRYRRKPRP